MKSKIFIIIFIIIISIIMFSIFKKFLQKTENSEQNQEISQNFSGNISKENFREEIIKEFEKRGIKTEKYEDFAIIFPEWYKNYGEIAINLHNKYENYLAGNIDFSGVVDSFLAGFEVEAEKLQRENIVFSVQNRDFLQNFGDAEVALKEVEWTDLIMIFAHLSEKWLRFLLAEDLLQFGEIPTENEVLENMRKLAEKNLKITEYQGLYILTFNEVIDSSIILLPELLTKEKMPVKWDIILLVKGRNMVVATGTEEENSVLEGFFSIQKLDDIPYPISDKIFIIKNWKIEEYKK